MQDQHVKPFSRQLFKRFKAIVLLVLMVTLFSGTATALEKQPTRVIFVLNQGALLAHETFATTVNEFILENNIVIEEKDVLTPSLDTELTKNMKITLDKAFNVRLRIDDAKMNQIISVKASPGILSQFVLQYQKETGNVYQYDTDDWHRQLEPGMLINLKTKTQETISWRTEIPFETIYQEDPELDKGVEVLYSEGRVGLVDNSTVIHYVSGNEVSREDVMSEQVQEPLNKIVLVGTKEHKPVLFPLASSEVTTIEGFTFDPQNLVLVKEMELTATAYTADYASTKKRPGDKYFGITASGMKAQVGVVAVDPKVIPMHSKLYIDGYGYAIAGDTGGSIKGNRIDLFFDTAQECKQFGRQPVKVFLLK